MAIKNKLNYNFAYLKIKPTLNNIFLTLTDTKGNVLISKHAGLINVKGSKKRTPFVAGEVVEDLLKEIDKKNLSIKLYILQIDGYIKNAIISSVIKKLKALQNNIFYIEYINKKAHNGLRPKKKRRL